MNNTTTVRFIEKTIAELEAISKNAAARARNDVNKNTNSENNAFVYNTNSKNFVINHVTQSLIPASQRINVGKVPYDVRGLRKLIDAGYIKAPHAPSENLSNDVANEVNRRTGGGSVGKLIFRTKRAKNDILKILKESERNAQGNTEKRLVDDFFQLVVLAVNATSNFYMVSPLVPTSSKFEVPRRQQYNKHFQIGTRIPSTDFELIADVHGTINPDDGTFDYLYYTNWIVVHPKFKIAFEHPKFEGIEIIVVRTPKTDRDMEEVLQTVLVPAFGIVEVDADNNQRTTGM